MPIDEKFHAAYRGIEARMKWLAESDGDVFLPNPDPMAPVQYVPICMEPSLGWWARSAAQAKVRVDAGFRNFLFSLEDFILHFCAQRYLCGTGQRYFITDLSKGAKLVSRAGVARIERYDRWYALLLEEIDLCATPGAGMVAVGNVVSQRLLRRGFQRPFTQVIHYSSQAGPARRAGIVGHEASFQAFKVESQFRKRLVFEHKIVSPAWSATRTLAQNGRNGNGPVQRDRHGLREWPRITGAKSPFQYQRLGSQTYEATAGFGHLAA